MRTALEEAEVDLAEIERLEPAMTNHAKDRHVLAAAVAADSEVIVYLQPRRLPARSLRASRRRRDPPRRLPLDLNDLDPEAVQAAVAQQAADLHPVWPLEQLLTALRTAGVPRFADAVRAQD